MANYLYKTTDDTVGITTPDPPSIVPSPEYGGGGGGDYPPPSGGGGGGDGGGSGGGDTDYIVVIDSNADGILDTVITCNYSGCSSSPYTP